MSTERVWHQGIVENTQGLAGRSVAQVREAAIICFGTVLPSVSTFNIDLLFFPQVKSILQVGFFTNRMFLYAVGASLMGQMLVIYFPPLQAVFQTEPLDWTDILLLICVSSSVLFVDEVRKLVIRIRSKRNQHQKDFNFLVWRTGIGGNRRRFRSSGDMWRHFVVFWGQFIVKFSKKEIVLIIFKM